MFHHQAGVSNFKLNSSAYNTENCYLLSRACNKGDSYLIHSWALLTLQKYENAECTYFKGISCISYTGMNIIIYDMNWKVHCFVLPFARCDNMVKKNDVSPIILDLKPILQIIEEIIILNLQTFLLRCTKIISLHYVCKPQQPTHHGVTNSDMIESLKSILQQTEFCEDFNYKLINHLQGFNHEPINYYKTHPSDNKSPYTPRMGGGGVRTALSRCIMSKKMRAWYLHCITNTRPRTTSKTQPSQVPGQLSGASC